MNISSSIRSTGAILFFAIATLVPAAAAAQAAQAGAETGTWQFTATIYGWVPTIDGQVNFPDDKGSTGIHASMSDVLNHLKMTFQGALDVHNGRWGIFNDVVYVDLGGVKSQQRDFVVGNVQIPATATTEVNLDLKALIWTVAGEYRIASDSAWSVDLLGGARMLRMKPTVGYSITGDIGPVVIPGRDGSKQVNEAVWDGIVGVKGRYAFGDDGRWFLPFYLDVGTGQSQLTWQISGGIGYSYNWGSVFATWRYLDYNFQSGKTLDNTNMSGPMLAASLRF
jgi:hypothetical protein